MKQFTQRLHKHLNDGCSGCSPNVKIAIAYAQSNRETQKRQLGDTGSLTNFCDRVMGKMLRDANMKPLPKQIIRPRPSSSGLGKPSSSSSSKKKSDSAWSSSEDEDEEDATVSSADREAIKRVLEETHGQQCAFIGKEDRALTSDYNYVVLKQFDMCKLAEEDRIDSREKYQAGHPGFKCRRCPKKFFFRDDILFGKLFNQYLGAHPKSCASAPSDLRTALSHLRATHGSQARRAAMSSGDFYRFVYRRLCKLAGIDVAFSTPSPSFRSRSLIRGRGTYSRSSTVSESNALFSDSSENDEDESISGAIGPIITSMDRSLATDYHYELLSQYGAASLSRRDKRKGGGFHGISVGQPGILCRHCKTSKFFFRSGDGFRSGCFTKTKDHIRTCPSVPQALRQRLLNWDWSQVQKQLRTIEGGNQNRLMQRLWMRLNHDWSRSKEIKANSRVTPLFQDESDVDLFDNSDDDDAETVNEGFSSTSRSSSGSHDEGDDDDTTVSKESATAINSQAAVPTLDTPSTSDIQHDFGESSENPWIPGCVTSDLTYYTTLAAEPITAVADKLGCRYKAISDLNKGRYPKLRTDPYRCIFTEGTILKIPSEDCDISLLVRHRKSEAVLPGAKSADSEAAAKSAKESRTDALLLGKVGGVGDSHEDATEEKSDIPLDKFVACAVGLASEFRLDLGMLVDEKFVAIVQALVGNAEPGRNESLVSMLTDGVRDAALGKTAMRYDGPLPPSAFEDAETNRDALIKALAVFARSRGGLFELVENNYFIAYALLAAPHCELPKAHDVMLCW